MKDKNWNFHSEIFFFSHSELTNFSISLSTDISPPFVPMKRITLPFSTYLNQFLKFPLPRHIPPFLHLPLSTTPSFTGASIIPVRVCSRHEKIRSSHAIDFIFPLCVSYFLTWRRTLTRFRVYPLLTSLGRCAKQMAILHIHTIVTGETSFPVPKRKEKEKRERKKENLSRCYFEKVSV